MEAALLLEVDTAGGLVSMVDEEEACVEEIVIVELDAVPIVSDMIPLLSS